MLVPRLMIAVVAAGDLRPVIAGNLSEGIDGLSLESLERLRVEDAVGPFIAQAGSRLGKTLDSTGFRTGMFAQMMASSGSRTVQSTPNID